MGEIWIPEMIVCVFLLLFLVRPFFKGLRAIEGLVWLPALGLLITLGIFPAYGFRPECLPLLLFEFALIILNFPSLAASVASGANNNLSERGTVASFIQIAFFAVVIIPVFVFSPRISLELAPEGVVTRTLRDESRKKDYFMRIYGATDGEQRPLIFLSPPEAGSVFAVDRICASLRDQGFIVISYSRRGFDSPASEEGKKYYASPARLRSLWRVFRKGTELKKANDRGKYLEAERRADIEFLLPLIMRNRDTGGRAVVPGLAGNVPAGIPVFLAGYGAAGSAMIYAAETPDFAARYKNVKGIIAVESRLWSAYYREVPAAPFVPENAGWFFRFGVGFKSWLQNLKTQKITGVERLPRPRLPVLYIVSDRAFAGDAKSSGNVRSNSYQAVLETMKSSSEPAALAAVEGAGPLDYSDFPLTHPLYPRLFPGAVKAAKPAVPVTDTAGIIGNFARMLLVREAAAQTTAVPENFSQEAAVIVPERRDISAVMLVERSGLPEF